MDKSNHIYPGRWSQIEADEEEITDLEVGMDFRDPQVRREVFLRFYEFHLKYRAHPGAVYYMFPYLRDKFNLNKEQLLWLAYLNGCSQNIISSWKMFCEFPSYNVNIDDFSKWFRENYSKLGWDTDRRYVKNLMEKCILSYQKNLSFKTQEQFFNDLCSSKNPKENFNSVWFHVMDGFEYFGRLSTFSYLEYLRIIGLNIDCNTLFLDDISGSKSHRNGLCKVLGRDDLDWHAKHNPNFDGKYTNEILEWLRTEGELLLNDARERYDHPDVSYFTLESTLCCYKSWHRPNRRYPNVYNDMFHNRIKIAESNWSEPLGWCWEARKQYLPIYLRLEDNPTDPGLCPEKQNHYRTTGQVIMMDREWSCFKNDFNDKISSNGVERFFE